MPIMNRLATWTRPVVMIPGNHDQVTLGGGVHALTPLQFAFADPKQVGLGCGRVRRGFFYVHGSRKEGGGGGDAVFLLTGGFAVAWETDGRWERVRPWRSAYRLRRHFPSCCHGCFQLLSDFSTAFPNGRKVRQCTRGMVLYA